MPSGPLYRGIFVLFCFRLFVCFNKGAASELGLTGKFLNKFEITI